MIPEKIIYTYSYRTKNRRKKSGSPLGWKGREKGG